MPRLLGGCGARWWDLDRASRIALIGIAVLIACAIAVRLWLMVDYGSAFLGFGDSHEYVVAATAGVFRDAQKPAGYPIFLIVLHALSDRLAFTILVQHILGVATGLLLFGAVRQTGAPPWLGLFPAAVAFFGGTGLLLEHSLLADPLFALLQAAAIYSAVRALTGQGTRWALAAGLASGASFWVKTVGLSSVLLIPLILLAAPGELSQRARNAAAAAALGAVLLLGYPAVQAQVTGHRGYERQGAWNLYGRVATFVDCTDFTPPAGTRFLCPPGPPSDRRSESYYQYGRSAPAVRRFGGPARAPAYANGLLQRFSVAAIVHEPIAYAGAILDGLTFYVSPRSGEGYTPEGIRAALLEPKGAASIQPAIAAYYPHSHGYESSAGAAGSLDFYERHTRIQGALLIVMLVSAAAGVARLAGQQRVAALLFALTAISSVTLAEAGNGYDARYGYVAFGPLAAAAALGGWSVAARHRRQSSARRTVP
jgi:hypothetical protein